MLYLQNIQVIWLYITISLIIFGFNIFGVWFSKKLDSV